MKTTRLAAVLLAVGPLSVLEARPSGAETYRPWCAVYTGRSGGRNCSFNSFEQCMMTAGPGTGASCAQNPWYLWYGSNRPGTTRQGDRRRR